MSTEAPEQETQDSNTDTETQPTGGTGTQQSEVDESTPVEIDKLPANVRKLIGDLRKENGTNRTKATSAEQKYATTLEGIAKALGIKGEDDKPDPGKLAKELADRDSKLNQTIAENAVLRHAPKLKGDPDALTDSASFMRELAKLDTQAEDYDKSVRDLIKSAVEKNPRLGIGTQVGTLSRDQSATTADTRTADQKYRDGETISDDELDKIALRARNRRHSR